MRICALVALSAKKNGEARARGRRMVADMLQELGLKGDQAVLEIGTGSGYGAAVLGKLAAEVHTVEVFTVDHRTGCRFVPLVGVCGWPG